MFIFGTSESWQKKWNDFLSHYLICSKNDPSSRYSMHVDQLCKSKPWFTFHRLLWPLMASYPRKNMMDDSQQANTKFQRDSQS